MGTYALFEIMGTYVLCEIMVTYSLYEIMGTCCLSVQIYRIGMTMSELEGAQQTWTDNFVSVVRDVDK